MTDRLINKLIVITGASHGIGRAIARCVACEGATTVLTDVDTTGENVAQTLRAEGLRAHFKLLDVRDSAAWTQLIAQLAEDYGPLDGLVNNAGVNVKYPPLDMPEAEWDRCIDINLRSVWRGCRAVLPTMLKAQRGSIVNIVSVHGHQIIPKSFPYAVAKHGLIGLTRSLGVEYAAHGVRVNAISPGYIDTRLCQDFWAAAADPKAAKAASEAIIPAKRIGLPEEVGMTAVFLLSDEAPFITASMIPIDGGRLALYHE